MNRSEIFTREKIKYFLRYTFFLMVSFAIIYGFLLSGRYLSRWIPLPGSLIGLLSLFLALECRIIKLEWLQPSGRLILFFMALFFIPAAVGIVQYRDFVMDNAVIITVTVVLGIIVNIAAVGYTFEYLARKKEHKKQEISK